MANLTPSVELLTPIQLASALQGPVVHVEFGRRGRKYQVHAQLLQHHSSWFETQISSLSNPEADLISLVDTDPGVFKLFVYYLYNQTFPAEQRAWLELVGQPYNEDGLPEVDQTMNCVSALIMANEFCALNVYNALNNYFVDQWCNHDMRYISAVDMQDLLEYMWEHLPRDKVMLQFLVDEYCLAYHLLELSDFEGPSSSLLVRCVKRFSELRDVAGERHGLPFRNRCYLEHASLDEKQECAGMHMVYDERTSHGYFR